MTLEIEGMHCEACVRRVAAALERADAGRVEQVTIGRAVVDAREGAGPSLTAALAKAGFAARVSGSISGADRL